LENVEFGSSFWERLAAIAAGGTLLAHELKHRSLAGYLKIALGAELIRRGVTGRRLFSGRFGNAQRVRPDRSNSILEAILQEKVDIGSELSFPAGDPPTY